MHQTKSRNMLFFQAIKILLIEIILRMFFVCHSSQLRNEAVPAIALAWKRYTNGYQRHQVQLIILFTSSLQCLRSEESSICDYCKIHGISHLGPGQYSVPSTLDRNKAFSFGVKVDKVLKNDVPSPCSYRTEQVNVAPAYSFGSRYEQKIRSDTPGMIILLDLRFFCFECGIICIFVFV